MGARWFCEDVRAKDAKQAFANLQACELKEYGEAGYTGTILEKESFVIIPLPRGKDAWQYARDLRATGDLRISDKWGPAGCIEYEPGHYLFFGWASH